MDVLAILIIKDGITLRNHAVVLEQDDGIRLIVEGNTDGDLVGADACEPSEAETQR